MSNRAKKVQKRNAKKKAEKKQINRMNENQRLLMEDVRRYQAKLTKSILIDILTNDLNELEEDSVLYFETLEDELGVNFDTEKLKPAAFEIEMDEEGVASRTSPWYETFIERLMVKHGEEEEKARERGWRIAAGVMTCMASADEIILSQNG